MAQIDTLKADVNALTTALSNLGALVTQAVSDINAQFVILKGQIAAGNPDLTDEISGVEGAIAKANDIATQVQFADPGAPAPDPAPPTA